MKQQLTDKEIEKIKNMCFTDPSKSCAIAQLIIDYCQVVSCSTFSGLTGKSKRTINYQAKNLIGIKVEDRKYISVNQ